MNEIWKELEWRKEMKNPLLPLVLPAPVGTVACPTAYCVFVRDYAEELVTNLTGSTHRPEPYEGELKHF